MNTNNNQKPFLIIENLIKTYIKPDQTKQQILKIDSITINKGSQYCIKGLSGSGKTTLLNIIAGILLPDSGSVTINDTNITTLKEFERDKFRAQYIGYIFQDFNLLQGFTALENVLIPVQFNKKNNDNTVQKAMTLLNNVGLKEYYHHKPSQLSFGQKQRVAIARALINEPEVLLADEPTGSLDKNTALEIINLTRDIVSKNNTTLLFATHDTELISDFVNIIEL